MNKLLKKERGVVAILVAIMMMIFVGMAAFAVDIGYYFVVKNRLQNAVDAAALNGVDTIYRANSLTGFPDSYVAAAEAAVYDSLSLNDFPTTGVNADPKITSTAIVVDWWDNSLIAPAGHYHYPAVQVSMSYDAGVFFAKIFDIAKIGVNVTATAVTPIPSSIRPAMPFVISYCLIDKGWSPPSPGSSGGPISGEASFVIGAPPGGTTFDRNYNCIADNISGTLTSGSNILTVNSGDFRRLSVGSQLSVVGGMLPSNTIITGVGTADGTGICTSAPCTYYLNRNATGNILATNIITAASGPLGNWTPLEYDTSSSGGVSNIRKFIPPVDDGITVPGVSIGQEIRVQTGTTTPLYQDTRECFDSGLCNLVSIPVVSGLPCNSSTHSCPAASTNDQNYPLTGVQVAPTGIPLNSNRPIIGFACVNITSVIDTGSDPRFYATLTSGCPTYGEGGGQVYYGVLLPPVLVH